MESWFVVQTKARAEQQVYQVLTQKALSAYLPRLLVRHSHGSRRWYALEPMFPAYVFVRFTPRPEVIAPVRWARGVRRLLGDGDAPTPVPEEVVEYLRDREAGRGFIEPGPTLTPGTRVRFQNGPLALLEGIIERPASGSDRVRVLLDLMRASVAVEVARDDLEVC